MKFSFATLSAFVSLVVGAVIPNAEPVEMDLEKRTVGGIYLCDAVNWGGNCGYAVQPLRSCINLGNDWNDKLSSFGPDEGTTCMLFTNHGCSGQGFKSISNPGSDDLRKQGINDLVSSFWCYPTGGSSGKKCTRCAPYMSYCTDIDCSACPTGTGTTGSCTVQ